MNDNNARFRKALMDFLEGREDPLGRELFDEWFSRYSGSDEFSSEELDGFKARLHRRFTHITDGPRRLIGFQTIAVAASILLIIGISLLFYKLRGPVDPSLSPIAWSQISAAKGTTVHVMLPDSSEVWLNAGTRMRYPNRFLKEKREVTLQNGEAYFEVKHRQKQAFIVYSPNVTTQVLGTSFYVRDFIGSAHVQVTVASGKVAVLTKARKPVFLTASMRIEMNKRTHQISLARVNVDNEHSWIHGGLRYSEVRFEDIAIDLENRFNISIRFKNQRTKERIISAYPHHSDGVEEILKGISVLNHNVVKKLDTNHYLIL